MRPMGRPHYNGLSNRLSIAEKFFAHLPGKPRVGGQWLASGYPVTVRLWPEATPSLMVTRQIFNTFYEHPYAIYNLLSHVYRVIA